MHRPLVVIEMFFDKNKIKHRSLDKKTKKCFRCSFVSRRFFDSRIVTKENLVYLFLSLTKKNDQLEQRTTTSHICEGKKSKGKKLKCASHRPLAENAFDRKVLPALNVSCIRCKNGGSWERSKECKEERMSERGFFEECNVIIAASHLQLLFLCD